MTWTVCLRCMYFENIKKYNLSWWPFLKTGAGNIFLVNVTEKHYRLHNGDHLFRLQCVNHLGLQKFTWDTLKCDQISQTNDTFLHSQATHFIHTLHVWLTKADGSTCLLVLTVVRMMINDMECSFGRHVSRKHLDVFYLQIRWRRRSLCHYFLSNNRPHSRIRREECNFKSMSTF